MPAAVALSGLSPLVVEDVVDKGNQIVVWARTPDCPAVCPGCGAESARVHGYHWRTVADVPLDGRPVIVCVQVRRLVCPTAGCRNTFREQVVGVLERYQRRTTRLTCQVRSVVRELAGRAGARLLARLSIGLSRHTAVRVLLGIPLPRRPVPAVVSVDDFALLRRHRYATVVIDPVSHDRVDVLADRKSDTLAVWLADHPEVTTVVRDGSATYAEAVRRARPAATQVSDRWHLWHGLARAVETAVAAHGRCWAASGPKRHRMARETTTIERWHAVHNLLNQGVGLLDCARRLGLALNTVKRYSRAPEPDSLRRPPQYRPGLVDPYRDHLRARRAAEPGVPVTHLFAEIKDLGYTGGLNLLYRYLNEGRLTGDRVVVSARKLTGWIMSRPSDLSETRRSHLGELVAACPEMTRLTELVRDFATIMTDRRGADLDCWIKQAREAGLPQLEPFLRGLDQDHDAAVAGLTLPYSNGPCEGVNTKTKLLKRQMYGRAGFRLLRHRILLG
ncbi:ISL3 family transposase [Nocardia sp. NBC_00881]|uniref:ISL3 family transposase n=1 Tax=Nocardia sp. NBC_00881 TaxID=2975995 RepID=UPI003862DD9E|nr:ISL3 family transposase [Nocardia sp. NBC_00881]